MRTGSPDVVLRDEITEVGPEAHAVATLRARTSTVACYFPVGLGWRSRALGDEGSENEDERLAMLVVGPPGLEPGTERL